MSLIQVLPPGLQNQIAAGEVIERPASVVKELMENSLDAGARSIQVYLESGGLSLIRIMDDGCGLAPEELPLALTRHATSKISSLEDLSRIVSFGFRGEALPSIASISQLTITSCPEGQSQGHYLKLIYGNPADDGLIAMNQGTMVKVENLLANVPARLKFLKTRATENKKCVESFIRHCLANLDVDFEFFSESRSLYRFFSHQSLRDRLALIWPDQVCDCLKEFSLQSGENFVHGLASAPESAQARADRILIYVNNRPVNDRMLVSAVRQACKGRLLSREYPQAVIFINVPPMEVDVNVHPAKNEVRFRSEKEIFSLVTRALRSSLDANIYQISFPESDPVQDSGSSIRSAYSRNNAEQENAFWRLKEKHSGFEFRFKGRPETEPQSPEEDESRHSSDLRLRYLGQVEGSYLLFLRIDSTLLIVDQHAAHERVMLEKIKSGFNKTVIKRLAVPETMAMHSSELEHLQYIWKDLMNMGFILEISPEKNLLVSGIPDFMSPGEAIDSLKDVLSRKKKNLDEIFISLACRSSVKSGTSLTSDEALGLMKQLLACENSRYCPHGRPVSRVLDSRDLEKMFKRR